ncbi:MAG: hypothetical protein GY852_06320 [bacterium]|nr:hypothetical protein [bacterium]
MALEAGTDKADSGMSRAIYLQIDALLSPQFGSSNSGDDGSALSQAREGWKQLSFAIAQGVIEHIKANMEIFGISTKGRVDGKEIVFIQDNDGTGHVK